MVAVQCSVSSEQENVDECWDTMVNTRMFAVLFGDMGNDKMQNYSVLADCMNAALSNEGVVPKRLFLEAVAVRG